MDDEILQEFLTESWENLSQLDSEIVELEKRPGDAELIASIFRAIHTIKGTCGFIGLNKLGSVAHSTENVLGQMRDGTLAVTQDVVSLVLEGVDRIKDLLEGLEQNGEEPDLNDAPLIARLDAMFESATSGLTAATPADVEAATVSTPALTDETVTTTPSVAQQAAESQATTGTVENTTEQPTPAPPVKNAEKANSEPPADAVKTSVSDLSIRVNVDVLDSLMNLVGELVLTRNQLLQMVRGDDESKYSGPIIHLNRVTTDLQEGVMKTRMQPIGNAWSKLPRLVRDLAQVTSKQIQLEMAGAETELDRTVLDAIKDPLTHMVRNSADHGIESPEVRREAGKPEAGTVKLTAFHEGGHVIICIEDDGAGINVERVRTKVVNNGILSEAEAAQLSDQDVLRYVFHPGLSTAEKVSSVSGRGVGMDVVRTQIEKIGGTVDLASIAGSGTTVRIKIPLTLAIISALVVESGHESFAIPQLGVVELVRLPAESRHKIETVHNTEVFRLRDRLLPLIHLDEVLGLSNEDEQSDEADINIVVVQVADEQLGLIVSEVFDTEEIVVKPVGSLLKDVNVYQGTTILGDGRVIMILDVAGVAAQAGSVSSNTSEANQQADDDVETMGDLTSLLLFRTAEGSTMSVPLSLVARLEEIPREMIEKTGDKLVVQYRGDLLPLSPAEGSINTTELHDPQPVIVFTEGTSSMGLMVDEIQDITQERLSIRMSSQRPGVLGTAIINGKATDVIDTQHYLMATDPHWFHRTDQVEVLRALVIDDSVFFRQLALTALQTEGFLVQAVENAQLAIDLIERGEQYDAIISDIEMPGMNGCQFAQWVRSREDLSDLPLIALTSSTSQSLEKAALQAGFNQYLVKFDANQLLSTIKELSRTETWTGAASA